MPPNQAPDYGPTATQQVAGEALPDEVISKLALLVRSRKFWASLVGIAFIVLGPRAGISEAEITGGVATIVAYIMGTALEDGLSN